MVSEALSEGMWLRNELHIIHLLLSKLIRFLIRRCSIPYQGLHRLGECREA